MKKITLSLLAFFLLHSLSYGQECGFDQKHRQRLQFDPDYARQVNQFNTRVSSPSTLSQMPVQPLKTTNAAGRTVYEIPVVVHVMDTGAVVNGPSVYSPSDALIEEMIDYLSDAFQAQYAGHLLESNGGTFIPLQFKLAQRTPDCQPTNGILRVDASGLTNYLSGGVGTGGVPDATLKALSYWPSTEYYNVWIVNKIDGADGLTPGNPFTAGYAYFPFPGLSPVDGTVILASQVGAGNSVITHELGHAFSLYHVFEGDDLNPPGYSCPPSSPTAGDMCADTKPIIRSLFNCPTINNCDALLDYAFTQHNFMDYSNCKDRFTPDQRGRVWGALTDFYGVRSSLLSSLGATPLSPSSMATACIPTAPPSTPNSLGPRAVRVVKPGASGDTLIFNAQSGSWAADGAQYFDRTCSHRLELTAGETYNFMVRVGANPEYVRAYIDYDNNGTFSVMEEIFSPSADYSHDNLFGTYSFTVPSTGVTLCSPVRMRVITNFGSIPGPCQTTAFGQAEDYEVIIVGPGSGGTVSNSGLFTLNTPLQGNPSCLGTSNTVSISINGTDEPIAYEWYRKSTTGVVDTCLLPECQPTDSFWTNNYWAPMDTVWAKVIYPGLCGIDTTFTDTLVMQRPLTIPPAVTIDVIGGTNPACPDDTITLGVVSNVNPGSANPPYEWLKNGVSLGLNMGDELQVFNHLHGDDYQVVMTSMAPAPCALPTSAFSNKITITHDQKMPTVDIALTQGTNPGCPSQALQFEVVGQTIGGSSPSFEWKVNGLSAGTGTQLNTSLNHGDLVHVEMTSNSACAQVPVVSSDTIEFVVAYNTVSVSMAQIAGQTPLCDGLPASFEAYPVNGGPAPVYQWLVNQVPVPGANGSVFTSSSLVNNDQLQVVLVSNDPCVIVPFDTSASLTITTKPSHHPRATIQVLAGDNPGCLDSLIKFGAVPTDFGVDPEISWYVNGMGPVFVGPEYEVSSLLNGDQVHARIHSTDGECYLPDTVITAPITMVRTLTPDPPVISLIGNQLYTNKPGTYVWYGPGGQLTGPTIGQYHPGERGTYWARTEDNGCLSQESNHLRITLLDIQKINLSQMQLYPNPTTGKLSLIWNHRLDAEITVSSLVGQELLRFTVKDADQEMLDISSLANGTYLLTVREAHGATVTSRVTLNR